MAAAVLLIAPLLSLSGMQPSGALPSGRSSSCKGAENPGAEMGMFPAAPASQSQLKVSCLLETDVDAPAFGAGYHSGTYAADAFTIHDFDTAGYHNGAARVVTASGASGAGTLTMTATFGTDPLLSWVNRSITGPGIAARTFVTSISGTTINLSEALTATSVNQTFRIDNAAGARSIDTGTVTTISGVPHLTTPTGLGNSGNFTAADAGLSVGGTRFPASLNCTIVAPITANDATLSAGCAYLGNPGTFAGQVVTIGGTMQVSTHRRVSDGLSVSVTRVSTIAGANEASDIGLRVYGTGLDPDTTISAIAGAGNKNLDLVCSAPPCNNNAAAVAIPNLRIGDDSGTAPADGEQVADLGAQLDLSPALVAGSQACAAEEPEGFHQIGVWRSPDNFAATAFGGTIPSGTRVEGQIVFDNAAGVGFAGYIVQRQFGTVGDPQGNPHYDVVFPSVPVAIAACAQDPDGAGPLTTTDYDSPGQALSLTVNATTASIGQIASGVGRPSTAQLRVVGPATGGYNSVVYVDTQGSNPAWTPLDPNFSRLCIYPSLSEASFVCGNG